MKFLGEGFQKLDHNEDRQTDRQTERITTTHSMALIAVSCRLVTMNVPYPHLMAKCSAVSPRSLVLSIFSSPS